MVSRRPADRAIAEHGIVNSSAANESASHDNAQMRHLSQKFALYRHLVPLLSQDGLTFLNAGSAPPSNLIVHEAITRYASEALYDARPNTIWQAQKEEARRLLARYINAPDPSSIAFTRDTTEGLGDFIRGLRFARGDNVVIADAEHPNQVYGWLCLRGAGLEVRQVATSADTPLDAASLRPYVDARTRAIGLSSMTFDAGQRHDVAGICAAFRPRGIHVLADATQQVGFAAVDVRAAGLSAAAFSLHKGLCCPTGLGALYVEPAALAELDPTPPIVNVAGVRGGRADMPVAADAPVEFHRSALRFEHQNLSLVAVVAARAFLGFYLDTMGPADVEAYLYALGDVLIAECDRLGIGFVGPRERRHRAPHICVLGLPTALWGGYLEGHGIRMTLNRLGVRVSFGFYNNVDDVKRLVKVLKLGLEKGLPAR
ncbi:PLP-dependent transferase [Xylariaceae sp. FL0662B]|nr:PLP-dependent transferase [Xylariaceae sp. FL0662B]